MCGRYSLTHNPETLAKAFSLAEAPQIAARYNIAPGQSVPAVRLEEGERKLCLLHWGLIPFWAKDAKIGYRTINARAETVHKTASFRAAFKARRCMIPASGFYEWQKLGKVKQPYHIARQDGRPLAFAGLWERWHDPEAPETVVESCTVVTTDANQALRPIHDRMPVILDPADYHAWLDPEAPPATLHDLLCPCPDDLLSLTPVSIFVNKADHEGPECVRPIR